MHHACYVKDLSDVQPKDPRLQRPNVCRSCGAIVGAGEMQCAVCGAPLATLTTTKRTPVADHETMRFARAVFTRPYKFTIIFLVLNIFTFLLMWQSSGMDSSSLWAFPPGVLIAYGAKLNFLIKDQNQWWRFVAPIFLHAGLVHLLVNMYALWMIGPLVEKLYGSAKFVMFWVLTGIAGVAASYFTVVSPDRVLSPLMRFLLKTQDQPSIGASGALFGLVGVLFVFGIKFRRELPEGFKRAFGTGLLPMIAINLVIGYLGRGFIDNAAHLGGLLGGAALALVVDYSRPGERKGVAAVWRFLQISSIALLVVSFAKVRQHFGEPIRVPPSMLVQRQPPQELPPVLKYFQTLNDAHGALLLALSNRDSSQLDQAVQRVDALPSFDAQADDLRARLEELLMKAKSLNEKFPSQEEDRTSPDGLRERKILIEAANKWTVDYETWLKTEGRKHGITVAEEQTNSNQ